MCRYKFQYNPYNLRTLLCSPYKFLCSPLHR